MNPSVAILLFIVYISVFYLKVINNIAYDADDIQTLLSCRFWYKPRWIIPRCRRAKY